MTGMSMMLKSLGLDLSPEGIKNLMAATGVEAKLAEAQGIVKTFVEHIDARFTRLDMVIEENHIALMTKLSSMHDDILDKDAAGPHSLGDADLIEPEIMLETHGFLRGVPDGGISSSN